MDPEFGGGVDDEVFAAVFDDGEDEEIYFTATEDSSVLTRLERANSMLCQKNSGRRCVASGAEVSIPSQRVHARASQLPLLPQQGRRSFADWQLKPP